MDKKKLIVFGAYLLISFLLLNKIFLNTGIILGGDWSLPINSYQSQSYLNFCSTTWSTGFFGTNNLGVNAFPFALLIRFFSDLNPKSWTQTYLS